MATVKFTNPPLIEVVLAIQLEDIEFSSIHFGLYWQTIRDRFPLHTDRYPILQEDTEYQLPPLRRAVFISSDSKKLIQLQDGYFSYSWRHRNDYEYPHFEEIFANFAKEWHHFQKWCMEQKLGVDIKPSRYELTYFNLFDKNFGWSSPADNQKVFTFVNSYLGDFLGTPSLQDVQLNFSLPNDDGVLIVNLDQRISEQGDSDFLLFQLTANSLDNSKDLTIWFQSAHDYLVKSFLDLTKKEAQERWGRLDD